MRRGPGETSQSDKNQARAPPERLARCLPLDESEEPMFKYTYNALKSTG
jgi:hypothetical protein